jgi:hypothetical protein
MYLSGRALTSKQHREVQRQHERGAAHPAAVTSVKEVTYVSFVRMFSVRAAGGSGSSSLLASCSNERAGPRCDANVMATGSLSVLVGWSV